MSNKNRLKNLKQTSDKKMAETFSHISLKIEEVDKPTKKKEEVVSQDPKT